MTMGNGWVRKARTTCGWAAAVGAVLLGCAQPKSPADVQREDERRADVNAVMARLRDRREGLGKPNLVDAAQSTVDEDALALERGECDASDCMNRFMRHALTVMHPANLNTIVRGFPLEADDLATLAFPPELEQAKNLRLVLTVAHAPKRDHKYYVFVAAEVIDKPSPLDLSPR